MSLLLRLLPSWVRDNPWAWLVALVVLVGLHLTVKAWHRARRLPPGPWGLPLVGYLPWLNPTAPHLTLSALAKRYGRAYSIQMGGVLCVVLADAQIMKDVFNRPEANGRAPLYLTHGIMKGYGLIAAGGAMWREHRKFLVQFMRASGMKGSSTRDALEGKLHAQARQLVEKISGHTGALDINHDLFHIIGNGSNSLVFGITYKDEEPIWKWLRHLLAMGIKAVAITGPVNFLPWFRFVPKFRRTLKYIVDNQVKTHAEYHKIIEAHEKLSGYEKKDETAEKPVVSKAGDNDGHVESNAANNNGYIKSNPENIHVTDSSIDYEAELKKNKPEGPGPYSIMEAYVEERKSRGDNVGLFTYKQLYHFAADIFGAGTDTQLTTLLWHFLNMALYPEIQRKVRTELLEIANGRDYIPYEESVYMHYTWATLMETQRLCTAIMGIPHGVEKDMIIDGYEVPAGTMLMPLITHVHNNPDVWGDPEVYRPERFINDDGTILRHPSFLPFQTGRRVCPGDEYARMLLFVYNSHILLNYDLKLPEDRPEKHPAEDPVFGVTISPRPYKLVFTKIER